jgi:diguanylate cyclase (GGDEF)-like protein/PAS domain S-box-containing protein
VPRLYEPARWFQLTSLKTYILTVSLLCGLVVAAVFATLIAQGLTWRLASMGLFTMAVGLTPAMVMGKTLEIIENSQTSIQAMADQPRGLRPTEATLDAQKQFLQNVIDSVPSMIVVKDRSNLIQVANQAAAVLHGITPTEMVGRREGDINPHLSPAEAERLEQISQQVMTTQVAYQLEQKLVDAAGHSRWYQLLVSPFKDSEGGVIGVVNNAIEITERKQVETALQEANQKLEQLATHDGLTQIANRRYFDEYLQQEWQRMTREQQPLSLILLDVDCFKAYNDYFGHQQGDEGLVTIAQAVQQVVKRSADLLARYGGEEFGVILPNTRRSGAESVAQAIQSEIKALRLPHPKSRVNDYLTVSMGIASVVPTPSQAVEDLVAAADSALYQAKRRGRDRYWIRLI